MSIDEVIKNRIETRVPWKALQKMGLDKLYIAGNCLNRQTPHDLDFFPVHSSDFDALLDRSKSN